jgi:hypothetical protein
MATAQPPKVGGSPRRSRAGFLVFGLIALFVSSLALGLGSSDTNLQVVGILAAAVLLLVLLVSVIVASLRAARRAHGGRRVALLMLGVLLPLVFLCSLVAIPSLTQMNVGLRASTSIGVYATPTPVGTPGATATPTVGGSPVATAPPGSSLPGFDTNNPLGLPPVVLGAVFAFSALSGVVSIIQWIIGLARGVTRWGRSRAMKG